ncbi:hypothetical protein GCM10022205_45430 [Spinactinospora alkalitolerans]
MFLVIALLIGLGVFLLSRRGGGRRPPWASAPEPPEAGARRVLADRFAAGDIGVDEFMERAGALNWVPGEDSGAKR